MATIAAGPVSLFGMMLVLEVDERDRHEERDEHEAEHELVRVVVVDARPDAASAAVPASTSG